MPHIPLEEIEFDPTSYVDPNGRVFSWKGNIYRAIHHDSAEFYRNLINDNTISSLTSDGLLVETELTDLTLDGFAYVLKHRRVPVLTYCNEWPAVMLKEAALLTLDLAIALTERDMTLQDAYPWNVYFDGAKPVFIDLGSIVEVDKRFLWVAYDQFCRFFLYPLYLYSAGMEKMARTYFFHYWEGVTSDDILKALPLSKKLKNPGILTRISLPSALDKVFKKFSPEWKQTVSSDKSSKFQKFNTTAARKRFLKGLRKVVAGIDIGMKDTSWTDYYETRIDGDTDKDELTEKQKIIGSIMERLKPESVLDLGCNTGRYSVLAAEKGARVISTDKDEYCVSALHMEAKERNLDIIPLVMDTINPTPQFGWCSKQFPSAVERLKSDMVFALALIHHLVFKQWQSFDRVMDTLDAFSKKHIIVEYVPTDDQFIKGCFEERFSWYTLENFKEVLERRYEKVESFPSHPEGRVLLLCTKKEASS